MSPTEAAKILDVPADSSPEQLEARFHELRIRLEEKIGKAPTPGLKAKYRESLDQITTAFETLVLAADSSSLPVTSKQGAGSKEQGVNAGGPVSAPAASTSSADAAPRSPLPAPRSAPRKSGSREFAIVAVIALALLGAGGWFVMKTRAENEEKARIAAEIAQKAAEAKAEAERQAAAAKAEQERLVQAARLEAEERKKAEEAERARQDKLAGQLRADLAEAKIAWEAIEREERSAERRLAELKSDLRSMRDAPAGRMAESQAMVAAQQDYSTWLSDTLARHPARIARGRAEELLAARQVDDARAIMQEFTSALRALEAEIPRQRAALLDLDGDFFLKTNPDVSWSLTDAFGRTRTGTGPAELRDVAVGRADISLSKTSWPTRTEQLVVRRSQPATLDAVFAGTNVRVTTTPAGARAFGPDGKEVGATPLQLSELAPGSYHFVLKLAGHYDQPVHFSTPGTSGELAVKMRARVTKPVKPAWRIPARFIYETSSTYATDGDRSTGTFAKDAWRYNSSTTSSAKEEWRFSEPDANGVWTRAERRLISSSSAQAPAGLVIRYTRQPEGKFSGEFINGEVTEPALRNAYLNLAAVEPTWGHAWLDQAWPPEDTPIGGTWKAGASPMTPGATGQVGKLLAFDRTPTADWVTLQFTSEHVTKGEAETRASHTVTLRINLGDGYIASIDGSSHNSMTVKAMLIGQIGTDTRGNYSYRMTVPAN